MLVASLPDLFFSVVVVAVVEVRSIIIANDLLNVQRGLERKVDRENGEGEGLKEGFLSALS